MIPGIILKLSWFVRIPALESRNLKIAMGQNQEFSTMVLKVRLTRGS